MPWNADGHWLCEVCDQVVVDTPRREGPWCEMYCRQRKRLCRPMLKDMLEQADSSGDGPMVNALCAYGRKEYGEDTDW